MGVHTSVVARNDRSDCTRRRSNTKCVDGVALALLLQKAKHRMCPKPEARQSRMARIILTRSFGNSTHTRGIKLCLEAPSWTIVVVSHACSLGWVSVLAPPAAFANNRRRFIPKFIILLQCMPLCLLCLSHEVDNEIYFRAAVSRVAAENPHITALQWDGGAVGPSRMKMYHALFPQLNFSFYPPMKVASAIYSG